MRFARFPDSAPRQKPGSSSPFTYSIRARRGPSSVSQMVVDRDVAATPEKISEYVAMSRVAGNELEVGLPASESW